MKRVLSEEKEDYKKQRSSELPINLFSGLSMRNDTVNDLVINTNNRDNNKPEISKIR